MSPSGNAFVVRGTVAHAFFCVVPVIVGSAIAVPLVAAVRAPANVVPPANVISVVRPDGSIIEIANGLIGGAWRCVATLHSLRRLTPRRPSRLPPPKKT